MRWKQKSPYKWADIDDVEESQQLLYWALTCIIAPWAVLPVDEVLKDILIGEGLAGDPGWEMDYISSESGPGMYRVWCDPEMSGIEPAEKFYTVNEVNNAVRESLKAYAVQYPQRAAEVQEVLKRYRLE